MPNLVLRLGLTSISPIAVPPGTAYYLAPEATADRRYGPVTALPPGLQSIQVTTTSSDASTDYSVALGVSRDRGLNWEWIACNTGPGPVSFRIPWGEHVPNDAQLYVSAPASVTVGAYLVLFGLNAQVLGS